jgi:hypothetical protein
LDGGFAKPAKFTGKTVFTVAKPPFKSARGGDLAGIAKF